MYIRRPKKIIFVGNSFRLLKVFSAHNETEAVSSISFIPNIINRFLPDLIVAESVQSIDISLLRKEPRLVNVPVLLCEENFRHLNNLNSISGFSSVIICNTAVVPDEKFQEHLNLVMEKKRRLLNNRTSAVVKYAVLFMNKNLSRKLLRSDFAFQLGVNESYLSRIFKAEMGISLWDYFTVLRLTSAREKLQQSVLTVKEIAESSGFSSESYFIKAYKKFYGSAPGKDRG